VTGPDRNNPGTGTGAARYPGTFLVALGEAAAGMGWKVEKNLGDAIQVADEQGKSLVLGLENLFRRCRALDRSEWLATITDFLKAAAASPTPQALTQNLDSVADQVLVRLGPPFRLAGNLKVWFQPLTGPGLGVCLVVDHDQSMSYVTEELLAGSGKEASYWMERALANLLARTPADCWHNLDDQTGLRMCAVGDAYDSSRALLLAKLLPDDKERGWIVALPGRDEFLLMPVTVKALSNLHVIKMLAEKHFQSSPYPISDDVFWIHEEVWRPMGIQIGAKEVTVNPPPEFAAILTKL
jgi:hypothetical protein